MNVSQGSVVNFEKERSTAKKQNLISPEGSTPMKDKAPQLVWPQSQFYTEQSMRIAISIFQLFIIQ